MPSREPKAERRELVAVPALTPPPGTPPWITSQLIARTLHVWQPYYAARLTVDDAVTMILGVSRLYDVVARGSGP